MGLIRHLTTRDGSRRDLLLGAAGALMLALIFGAVGYGLSGGAVAVRQDLDERLERRENDTDGRYDNRDYRMERQYGAQMGLWGLLSLAGLLVSGAFLLVALWCVGLAFFGRPPPGS